MNDGEKRLGPLVAGLLACGIILAPAARVARAQEPERERRAERERHEAEQKAPDTLGPELAKRLRTGRLDDVEITVRWPYRGDVLAGCRVVGSGVGIWKRQAQFSLSQREFRSLLKTVQDARFGSLPVEMGDEEAGEREQKGHITVSAGALSKTVVQLAGGQSTPALERIADTVLAACDSHAADRVRVKSFEDAWTKLASGTLAPETLEIDVQRRTDHPGDGPSEDWSMRINGRRVYDRDRAPGAPRASVRELLLSPEQYSELLSLLRASGVPEIPVNVYAAQYTDVRIRVLDQLRHVQARPFAGMTRDTHGDRQRTFETLFDSLASLHRRAVAEGRVVREASPAAAPAAGQREKNETD